MRNVSTVSIWYKSNLILSRAIQISAIMHVFILVPYQFWKQEDCKEVPWQMSWNTALRLCNRLIWNVSPPRKVEHCNQSARCRTFLRCNTFSQYFFEEQRCAIFSWSMFQLMFAFFSLEPINIILPCFFLFGAYVMCKCRLFRLCTISDRCWTRRRTRKCVAWLLWAVIVSSWK